MSSKEKFKSVLEHLKNGRGIPTNAFETLTKAEREVIEQLRNDGLIDEALEFVEDLDSDMQWQALRKKMEASKRRAIPLWRSAAKYAALVTGLLAVVYFYRHADGTRLDHQISEKAITLKIGEDAVKIIREGESQQLVSASGQVVGEQKGNRIVHRPDAEIDKLVYNELEIPFGKIFDVELSDGTVVHLNSGTKIRYPIQFLKGREREVFIDGEAFFKVAKDEEHPFIVHAEDMAVEVLGTEFNISSYKEDAAIKTVLVEGAVSLSHSGNPGEHIRLEPGEKASWNKTGHDTEIETVDVSLYTGWIKGEMIFRNATFADMAKKLERRYDTEIQINNMQLRDKKLNARFNVNVEGIADVLNSIREIQDFEYQITGQKVVID